MDLNRDSSITVKPGTGDIQTKRNFGDFQLHVEFRTPAVVTEKARTETAAFSSKL